MEFDIARAALEEARAEEKIVCGKFLGERLLASGKRPLQGKRRTPRGLGGEHALQEIRQEGGVRIEYLVNARGGRDHWSKLGMIAFAGGGLKMGQVVGQSDRLAAEPASDPVTPRHLMATIMHTLFDVGKLRVQRGLPSELVKTIDATRPIPQL